MEQARSSRSEWNMEREIFLCVWKLRKMEKYKNNKKSKECVIKIYAKTEKEEKSAKKCFVYKEKREQLLLSFWLD